MEPETRADTPSAPQTSAPSTNAQVSAAAPSEDWRTYLEAGDAAAALRHYKTAQTPSEEVLEALRALSEVRFCVRAKRWAKAQRALAGVEAPPEHVAELSRWEEVKRDIGRLETANKHLDRREVEAALERLQEVSTPLLRAEAETQRGTAHILVGDSGRAKRSFEEALARDPKHYRALTNLGNVALEENRVDDAITAYEAALRLDEDFANAHHNLGVAYRRKGQIDRSVRSIRRAQKVQRRQEAEEARRTLSSLNGRIGRLNGRSLRYTLYVLGAALLFFWLRSQGLV